MAKLYKIQIDDGKGGDVKPLRVEQGAGDKNSPLRLLVQKGARVDVLQERKDGTATAPDQVRAQRRGKDLQLWFDGSKQADVVLEGYYEDPQALPQLTGLAENGNAYEYVPQDPDVNSLPAALKDGNTPVALALGGAPLPSNFELSGLPLAAAAAGGGGGWLAAGGAGLAAAAAGGGGGGGGGTTPDTTPPSPVKVVMPEAASGINAQEAADGTSINAELPADAVVGDTLTTVVTRPDGTQFTLIHVLTAADIAAKSVTQTIAVADFKDANGQYMDGNWSAASTLTDVAKNTSTPVTTAFTVDTTGPVFTSTDVATAVSENSATSTTIYTALATGATAYSLKAGALDSDQFVIDSTTGVVKLKTSPDFETKPNYSFTVLASDAAGNVTEKTVTLAINNVDEVAPTFNSSIVAAAVSENTPIGATIYTALATDVDFVAPNTASSVTYKLKAGDDASKFTINADTGEVKLAESPNYEVKSSYKFTVIAEDAVGHASEQMVTMAVKDVAEAATITFPIDHGNFRVVNSSVYNQSLNFNILVSDQDTGESGLSSTASLVGVYGRFDYVPTNSNPTAGLYNWKYTLDGNTNPALTSLATPAHDLQVVSSLDGSAYETIDIAINTDSTASSALFHTKNTLGVTVRGDASHVDTLKLHGTTGDDLTLDLTLATNKVATLHSIERIDVSDPQNYTVKLNLASLLQADTTSAGVHQLTLAGGSGDSVLLAHELLTSQTPTSAAGYDHYAWTVSGVSYELLIQQGMTVSFMA